MKKWNKTHELLSIERTLIVRNEALEKWLRNRVKE